MRITSLFQRLLLRLRNLSRPPRATPRFRDPVLDFCITATPAAALDDTSEERKQRGAYLTEHGNYLSLHLGGSTADGVHAVMDRTAPAALVFSYTQIMAGFSMFVPPPRTIGMLGLGGGSLAKHCYQSFPVSRIVVAEISREVLDLRRHFLVPDDDARFAVLLTDGAKLVRNSRNNFDVLLIDAFDEGGHLSHLGTRAFYRNCHRALSAMGVLVLNFSGEAWQAAFQSLNSTFAGRILLYRCPDGDNVILFACKGSLPDLR